VWSWNPQTKRFGRPPKKKALLIGINYTDQHEEGRLGELIGPHRDVTEMRDLLISEYPAYVARILWLTFMIFTQTSINTEKMTLLS